MAIVTCDFDFFWTRKERIKEQLSSKKIVFFKMMFVKYSIGLLTSINEVHNSSKAITTCKKLKVPTYITNV